MNKVLDVFANGFQLWGDDNINEYIRGGLFEKYIQYYAVVNNTGFPYSITSQKIEEVPVDAVGAAASVIELVAHVICKGRCQEPETKHSLYLNKDKREPFKGYDFAPPSKTIANWVISSQFVILLKLIFNLCSSCFI